MNPRFFSFAILLTATGMAHAQQAERPRWGLGVGAAVSSGVYAGEDTRTTPFPLISYRGDSFYWRGISGGLHLLKGEGFSLDATLSARMDGMDVSDFGRTELAERGINQSLLEDRDDGFDLGLAATWRGSAGELTVDARHDVSGASKGFEAGLKYAYPVQWGKTRIAPNIGVSHYSKKLANYYYGTLPGEAQRGVVAYQPGSVTLGRVGVDVMRPFAERWVFIANMSYTKLPGKISDSPLVEKDTDGKASAFIGVSRGF